jgi:hypothetical protein
VPGTLSVAPFLARCFSDIVVFTPVMSSQNTTQCEPKGRYRFNAIDVLCVIVLLAYFLHFALPSLAGGFGEDEMTNIYACWRPGTLKVLWANVCFWTTFYRPCGALYYLPLYHFFSLNPLPYRIVQISILAATIPLFFCLARLLSGSRTVAFLVALASCYHAQMAILVFGGSFIYDVLCGFFYFAALAYYVYIREKGMALRPGQLAIFLALFICALNSKEMAVSLPVIVLIYEALKYPWLNDWNEFSWRNWSVAIPALVATLVTAIYIYGKLNGPRSLANLEAYRPVYSWHRFTLTNAHFINDLLYQSTSRIGRGILLAWPVVFVYAFWRRDRLLQLMAFWVVITPLPLAFILLRGAAMFYIVLFGWATIFARMLSDLIGLIAKVPALAGPRTARMLPTFATAAVAIVFAVFTHWESQRFHRTRALLSSGQKSLHVIQAFRSLNLHPSPGSSILLKPETRFYQNGYYPAFVAWLVWNDRSLRIYVAGQDKLTQREIGEISYVISFNEFEAQLVPSRGPITSDAIHEALATSSGKVACPL